MILPTNTPDSLLSTRASLSDSLLPIKNADDPKKTDLTGVGPAYSVMAKTLVGSGMMGMAYAATQFGVIFAVLFCIFAGVASWFSLYLMSFIAQSYDSQTYGMLSFFNVVSLVNPKIRWLVDLSVVIKGLGASVGFLLIAGTLFAAILEEIYPTGTDPETLKKILILVVVILLSPVLYAHRLNTTRFTNAFGLISLGYLAILAVAYADPSLESASLWPVSWVGMLARFPVFMFAFLCHHNFFQVAEEMPNVTLKKLNFVSVSAVTTGLVVFIPTMILPYMTYGQSVGANFLTSMPVSETPVKVACIAAALSVSFSLPLTIHPSRRSVELLIYRGKPPTCDRAEWRLRFTETLTLNRSRDRLSPLGPKERIQELILRILLPFFLARPKNAQSFFDFLFSGAYSRVRSTKVGELTGFVASLAPLIYKLQLAGFYAGLRNRYLTDEVVGISRVSLAADARDEGGLLYPVLSFMTLSTLLLESYERWRRKSGKISEKTRRYSWSNGTEQGGAVDTIEMNLGYQQLTCLICYSQMKSPAALVCGHLFCWRCVLEWLEENSPAMGGSRGGCPLCRTACKPQQVVPVFHFASSECNDKVKRVGGAPWLSWLPWRES
ncbi:hypothetical protein FOL47_000891 [Perkinsus chesapeaki]|uniref:RING-type domain-containing protein n=1 Tax=Perkinsus chesapeaki TaxID=330153 RepID=A0A7J6MLN7_PERCH|nr:hypothetical protein FOL47_000891 [Perkinsus chesapeaki]